MKLKQKQFMKGSREFEIIDDAVVVRIKHFLKEEKITVGLSTIDPEPIVNEGELEFYSRYQGRPVLSLLIDKPNAKEFNVFVEGLKQQVSGNLSSDALPTEAPGWNVYEEPEGFNDTGEAEQDNIMPDVNIHRLDDDIVMLKNYLNEDDIKNFLDSLKALKSDPKNEVVYQNMKDSFNDLGINQGAVLTYAPYIKVLLSQSLWQ